MPTYLSVFIPTSLTEIVQTCHDYCHAQLSACLCAYLTDFLYATYLFVLCPSASACFYSQLPVLFLPTRRYAHIITIFIPFCLPACLLLLPPCLHDSLFGCLSISPLCLLVSIAYLPCLHNLLLLCLSALCLSTRLFSMLGCLPEYLYADLFA